MKLLNQNLVLVCLGVTLLICLIFVSSRNNNVEEGFADDNNNSLDTMEKKLLAKYMSSLSGKSDEELRNYAAGLRLRLDKYGLYPGGDSPDLSKYALKTEVSSDLGKCTVASAEDRDKYMHKSDIANLEATNKVDLSKYVLKTSIPPEKVCPPQKEVDYSKYVLKSTLPPNRKCPPCICPKVKVSAGLCKRCPPPPKCPPPEPCAQTKCPEPRPCPKIGSCPGPKPCPTHADKIRYDVKYIKVPTLITKTVVKDQYGNVLTTAYQTDANVKGLPPTSAVSSVTPEPYPTNAVAATTINSTANQTSDNNKYTEVDDEEVAPEPTYSVSTYANNSKVESEVEAESEPRRVRRQAPSQQCATPELNSAFKKTGVYGYPY